MTAVPSPTFGPTGFAIPAESAVLAGVQADMNAAFGGNLNPDLTTPQGQLASSMTAAIADKNDQFLALTNGVDPAFATGRMQDAIARIYFLTRNAAQPTTVLATCVGLVGTVIPTGAQAKASDGNIYLATTGGTIPAGGSLTLSFQCSVTGPIACQTGALATIYQTIPGWDTISNPVPGVVGNDVETPAAFEARRKRSVALNSVSPPDAILAAVLSVPNVIDAYVVDNPTNAPVTIGGVTLAAHSVYVAAVGGSSMAVAQALWSKKPPGCNYNGNTSVTVYDPNPLYQTPPSYAVTYEIPPNLSIFFNVTMSAAGAPANALALVQAALQYAFAGEDGGPRARIGSTIFALRFYSGIAAAWPGAQVVSIAIGSANAPGAVITGSISATTLTVSATSSGAVAIGQFITGTGVTDGTYVVSGSGSTWTVSQSQTAASETMTLIAASLADLTVQINQEPVLSSADVQLTLV
ncbi:MAG TPA: baseplate J/gp47 family protein [Caulobacteraceae bacterium]|jgi:hypothetical protein|nr:baseplate J/gp47 family protein [Caulobacteraceae bacterium]